MQHSVLQLDSSGVRNSLSYTVADLIEVAIGMKFGYNVLGNIILSEKRENSLHSSFTFASSNSEFPIVFVKAGVDMSVSSFLFPLVGIVSVTTVFLSTFLKMNYKIILILQDKENE